MPILVERIEPSNRKGKRYMAIMTNGDRVHFGQDNGETFIDHHDKDKRKAFHARYYGNKRTKELIDSYTISPALMSMFLLWGMYPSIQENMKYLNSELEKKHHSAV
jgi:hypothetical protein